MNPTKQMIKAFALLSGIGFYFAIVMGICIYIGIQADDFFQLNGKGRLLGILFGFPVAIYSVYRQLKMLQ